MSNEDNRRYPAEAEETGEEHDGTQIHGSNIGKVIFYNFFKSPQSDYGARIPNLEDLEDFEQLTGKYYVNLKERLSEHSNVYLGMERNKKEFGGDEHIAVKLFPINTKEEAQPLIREANAIKSLNHQNIIKFIEVDFCDGKIKCAYLAMELCDTSNLHDHVEKLRGENHRFTALDCMSITRQLAAALTAVHDRDIYHRDIKPSNVLFKWNKNGTVIKLTDFSMEKPAGRRAVTAASNKRIGTDGWRAPEALLRNEYGKPSDVFSLGLTFYYVWSNGEQAFGMDPDLVNYNIKNGRNRNLSKIQFSDNGAAKQLLEKMLAHDHRQRPTAANVLKDPFCKDAEEKLENPIKCELQSTCEGRSAAEEKITGESIVLFDRKSTHLQAYIPSKKTWGHMQAIKEDIITWDMTVVVLGDYIYTLLQNQRVYRIKFNNPNAGWELQNDLLFDHGAYPSAAVLDGSIYVIGGSEWGTETVKQGEVLTGDKRSQIPDMLTARKVHSIVACKGCIYSIGGWDTAEMKSEGPKEAAVARGEKFDPQTEKWSEIHPMERIRYATAAVAKGDKIYVLGGWREGNRLTEAECYDTNTDTWTRLANMNIRRSFFTAVACEGKIYAIDGDDIAPQTIEEYDPVTNEWKKIEKMVNMQVWRKGAVVAELNPALAQSLGTSDA